MLDDLDNIELNLLRVELAFHSLLFCAIYHENIIKVNHIKLQNCNAKDKTVWLILVLSYEKCMLCAMMMSGLTMIKALWTREYFS